MPNLAELESALPVAPLKIIALDSCKELGDRVNEYLVDFRKHVNNNIKEDPAFREYSVDNYLVEASCPRFGTGESKGILKESVRGDDVFIMVDITNHSLTYTINGFENHKSPDDHYQDLKRMIAAITGKAHRINVVMPFMYEGRQHKRSGRESLDCAYALKELSEMGVSNFITFDAHDPRVQNATPLKGFDNFTPPYQFIRSLLEYEKDIIIDKEHMIVISPDEGALDRAVYFSTVLGVDTGMFYKRRDYSVVVNGRNPILAHEFLGDDVEGKDCLIIDDMISSGDSMIEVATKLKELKANRIFVCTSFGLFCNGLQEFDKAYEAGIINGVFTTNLVYRTPELLQKPWYFEVDMSKYCSLIIDTLNHDCSVSSLLNPADKIKARLEKYKELQKKEELSLFNE